MSSWPERSLAQRALLEIRKTQGDKEGYVSASLLLGDVKEGLVAEWATGRKGKGEVKGPFQLKELLRKGFGNYEVGPFFSGGGESSVLCEEDSLFKKGDGKELPILEVSKVRDIVPQDSQPSCELA